MKTYTMNTNLLSKATAFKYCVYQDLIKVMSLLFVSVFIEMIYLSGYKERKSYLTTSQRPSLMGYLTNHSDSLPTWCLDCAASSGAALFGVWWERYKQMYSATHGTSKTPSKPKFDDLFREFILAYSDR